MEKEEKMILIVEDEPALSRALNTKLTSEGFHILTARNGMEGLKTAIENKPDLILLDILMPVMDGMSMLKELRKDEWGKNAKVIILTNLGDNKTKVADAIENEVTEYLVKTNESLGVIVEKIKAKLYI